MKNIYLLVFLLFFASSCSQKQMLQSSSSMEPTIKKGDVINVNFNAYTGSSPQRWDIVVFNDPTSLGTNSIFCSRIVGLPGEFVDFGPSGLLINGRLIISPVYTSNPQYTNPAATIHGMNSKVKFPYKIPNDRYFVLGDNVSNALDSRYWGGLKMDMIIGRVIDK
jgi:signal peptidase I